MDFNAEDMSPSNAAAGRSQLRVQFYRRAILNETKSDVEGVPVWEDRVMIKKLVPGDSTSIIDTLAIINKRHPNADNNLFPEQYAAFLRNEAQEASGVPLAEFPALLDSQRKTLEYLEIRTVEQLAALADNHMQHLQGGNALRQKASDFLKARTDSSHVLKMSAELAKRDAEIAKDREERGVMQAQMAEMAAKLEALKLSDKSAKK